MPIRTRRGRTGAYRALWTWPLHSPARLTGVLAVTAALAVGLSVAAGAGSGPGPDAVTAAPTRGVPTPRMAAVPGAGEPVPPGELIPQRLPLSAVPPAALGAATAWTTAWVTHPPGTSPAAWASGLAPWTTEEYLPQLTSVDPARVPGTRVSGPAVAVDVHPDAVRVQVPTDAVRLELLLVQTAPGRWRVATHEQVP